MASQPETVTQTWFELIGVIGTICGSALPHGSPLPGNADPGIPGIGDCCW